jgi:hypothetical protein
MDAYFVLHWPRRAGSNLGMCASAVIASAPCLMPSHRPRMAPLHVVTRIAALPPRSLRGATEDASEGETNGLSPGAS